MIGTRRGKGKGEAIIMWAESFYSDANRYIDSVLEGADYTQHPWLMWRMNYNHYLKVKRMLLLEPDAKWIAEEWVNDRIGIHTEPNTRHVTELQQVLVDVFLYIANHM